MKTSIIALFLLIPLMLTGQSSAQVQKRGSHPNSRLKLEPTQGTAEVYPARIAEDAGSAGAPPVLLQGRGEAKWVQAKLIKTPRTPDYDYVTPVNRDSIADRLIYVEELVVKHGRAYDYRSHTTRELKATLDQLNGTLQD